MLKRACFALSLGLLAILAAAWESFGYPTQEQICEVANGAEHCASYNILLATAWQAVAILDRYSVLLTAIATIAIAAFTITLWLTSAEQARLTREALKLATDEFVATHRPKLRVRRFRAHLDHGWPVRVTYVVVNVGESDAHIKRIETTIGLLTTHGESLQVDTTPEETRTIVAGENCLYITAAKDLKYDVGWGINEMPGTEIAIRGTIDYLDDNGTERCTGFWRTRDNGARRFQPKDDPDYEYED